MGKKFSSLLHKNLKECHVKLAVDSNHPGFLIDVSMEFMLVDEKTDLRIYPTRGVTRTNTKTRTTLNNTTDKAC